MTQDGTALGGSDAEGSVIRPLTFHPELEIRTEGAGSASPIVEYRVRNFRTLPSGRIVHGDGLGLRTWCLAVPFSIWLGVKVDWEGLWTMHGHGCWLVEDVYLIALVLLLFGLIIKSRIKLYQSLTTFPNLGLQLNTTKLLHLPFFPLTISDSRTFIPINSISTVVINEGPYRWSIRYYLAIILRRGQGIHVAFDIVRPRHAVLREVYHGIREQLYDEYADD